MRTLPVLLAAAALAFPCTATADESYTTLDALWGDEYGTFNGISIPTILDGLIASGDPLVVGASGRSVSFTDGSEQCILDGLPAVGRVTCLPDGIGDAAVGADCVLPASFPANRRGRFKNRLIDEVIKLSLNARLDPDLEGVALAPTMKTVDALPGADGLFGTDDDVVCADCDTVVVDLPEDLMTALAVYLPVGPTVGGLLGFANSALGEGELYGTSYRDVWRGVRGVNRAFDGCRFYANAPADTIIIIFFKGSTENEEGSGVLSGPTLAARSAPGRVPTLHLTLPEASEVRVVAYTVAGRKAAVIADRVLPTGETVVEFGEARALPCGVYLVRSSSRGVESGETAVRTTKVVVVR